MPIPKTVKGISSPMFWFVLFMTSVIDIQTIFPKVICGSNCIPVTFSCHICDKLQSTEFKNMFPDYYREHPQSKHWQNEEHIYVLHMNTMCSGSCGREQVSFSPKCLFHHPGSVTLGLAQGYLCNHWPTGQNVPSSWFASCCLKGLIMAECRLNGNINLSLSLLTSCCILWNV